MIKNTNLTRSGTTTAGTPIRSKIIPIKTQPNQMPKQALPKGRITPGYMMPMPIGNMKTTTPMVMPKKKTPLPVKPIPPRYGYTKPTPKDIALRNNPNIGQLTKQKTLPKKAMPMNYKNPKYKPSNGVGVGY